MRTRKIQSKIEPELELHVRKQKDFKKSMSNYVRTALIERTKFKTNSRNVRKQVA